MDATLAEARVQVQLKARNRGTFCPCCDQYVRVYQRAITATMARALIWLSWYQHLNEQQWVHVNTEGPDWIHRSGGSFATMRHWGFIKEKPAAEGDDEAKRCQGFWQITPLGRNAVGLVKFPRYVYLFNNEKVGDSDERTDLKACLGTRFDYQKLMEARADV